MARLHFRTAERLGGGLGIFVYHLGIRRALVAANMKMTLPDMSARRRRKAIRQSYASLGANVLSMLATYDAEHPFADDWQQMNPQWCEALGRRYPAAVYVTMHLGAWECNAWLTIRHLLQDRIICYATAQHFAAADAAINERRTSLGADMVFVRDGDRRGALDTMRNLRRGLGSVYLLADQGPRPQNGVPAWFLGQPTYCHHGPVIFAQRCGVPIIPCCTIRIGAGRFRYFTGRPLHVDGMSEAAAVQVYMDWISALIARFPGQYFWQHRRFKHAAESPPRDYEPWQAHGLAVFHQAYYRGE